MDMNATDFISYFTIVDFRIIAAVPSGINIEHFVSLIERLRLVHIKKVEIDMIRNILDLKW
jgi:hypothetical protein